MLGIGFDSGRYGIFIISKCIRNWGKDICWECMLVLFFDNSWNCSGDWGWFVGRNNENEIML